MFSWLAFFLFHCGFLEKIEPSWKTTWFEPHTEVDHNTTNKLTAIIIFLSEMAAMQLIFWAEFKFLNLKFFLNFLNEFFDFLHLIFDCRDSFKCKLKRFINKNIIFYNLSNPLCSLEGSLQIKCLKHHTFIGTFCNLTCFNLQILNLC